MMLDVALAAATLGGLYALLAMGLTLQYGVARIMNLGFGELMVAAAFMALSFYSRQTLSPFASLLVVPFAAFVLNYLVFRFLMSPLMRRAKGGEELEADTALVTFGLLFVVQGYLLATFGGTYYSYSFLATPYHVFGTVMPLNRVLVLAVAVAVSLLVYLYLRLSRVGAAIRAAALDPNVAEMVAIDVKSASAFTYALGGAMAALAGVLASMFMTLGASMGVVFTFKAFVLVFLGGVGSLLGALLAGLILGAVEHSVAVFVDPALTFAASYAVLLLVLLLRPQGLLGRAGA